TNDCGPSLSPSSSCSVTVKFTPASTGTLTASLTITDNASGSPQTASLSGTGINPTVTLSAANVSFGNQNVETTSAPQAVTLTNSGLGTVTIDTITTTLDFAQTNNCGSSLA